MKISIQWVAVYKDGSKLYQYNGDKKNTYYDIDHDNLAGFCLLKGEDPLIYFLLEEGQRLIYKKRVIKKMTGEEQIIYLAGWQQKVKGKNVQSIACVFPSGQIQMISKWNKYPFLWE